MMERNLEDDIRADAEIMQKMQDEVYAQNVYAALCNIRWQPTEVWTVLQDEWWTCSWRSAGGIVADLRGQGDYMSWYCSGMGNGEYDGQYPTDYVPEGTVTEEIAADFARIGWQYSEWLND
jgi:hypothetical protein